MTATLSKLSPGRCAKCNAPTWRTTIQQREINDVPAGSVVLLWPDPASVYVNTVTETGWTVGAGYCPGCAPRLGEPGFDGQPVIGIEAARKRYVYWYSDEYGVFAGAHLCDQVGHTGDERDAILRQWEIDRR